MSALSFFTFGIWLGDDIGRTHPTYRLHCLTEAERDELMQAVRDAFPNADDWLVMREWEG